VEETEVEETEVEETEIDGGNGFHTEARRNGGRAL
jgi:hypothetical protein